MYHGFMMGAASGLGGHYIDKYQRMLGVAGEIAASAALGGTISELGGGKFANGAITSAFSIMFNELMHPNLQLLKQQIEEDGRLSFSEAKKWYRIGDGSTITVDINSLNLDYLAFDYNLESMPIGYVFSFSTLKGGIGQFLVYGSITAKYYGNNNIKLFNDRYDFEQHTNSNESIRNFETYIGSKVHGRGTAFDIQFNGKYHITPRNIQLQRIAINLLL